MTSNMRTIWTANEGIRFYDLVDPRVPPLWAGARRKAVLFSLWSMGVQKCFNKQPKPWESLNYHYIKPSVQEQLNREHPEIVQTMYNQATPAIPPFLYLQQYGENTGQWVIDKPTAEEKI